MTKSAHLNLRDEFLPYKHLIATVLHDKNPTVRTVINKTDDVGQANEYRTFGYELLAGDPDLNVEIHEANCTFRFDYSTVYWNSRLSTEHRRLVEMFRPGEAVCDVMAGVGPFAVPAGKKNVFVWANDLNPDSFASLDDAVRRNKVRVCERSIKPYFPSLPVKKKNEKKISQKKLTRNPPRSTASSGPSTKTAEPSSAPPPRNYYDRQTPKSRYSPTNKPPDSHPSNHPLPRAPPSQPPQR